MGTDGRLGTGNTVMAAAVAVMAAACIFATVASAAMGESDVPATSVVPAAPAASSSGAASTPAGESMAPAAKAAAPAASHKKIARREKFNPGEVEPAKARLKLVEDTWAYANPAESSAHVERVHKGKYVIVTGTTRYFVQVRLKSGKTAYVNQSAVDLVRPTDKIFHLTSNAAVLDRPDRWGKKLAEVHTPHDVHVVGIALNYVKIRMKSGLEGYIPTTALQ